MNRNLNIASKPSFLPLRDAVLCDECEFVSADSGEVCQVCGSHSLVRLSDVIKGKASVPLSGRDFFHFFSLRLGGETS